MRPRSTVRRRALVVGAVLLALASFAPGCGRPPDEAWLRFLGFREINSTTPLALLEGNLRDGTTDGADAEFRNGSEPVGVIGSGSGILVYRARVDYQLPGFAPPSAEYPLNLYILPGAPAAGSVPASDGTATLTAFPLASVALKSWLLQTRAFDDPALTPAVDLTARVTFYGVTDEGLELETTGGIAITLLNAQQPAGGL